MVIPEVIWLAINVWMESRGEPYEGKLAVAWATVNRAEDRRWPESIPDVVWQAYQFSWTNPKDPNRMQFDRLLWSDPRFGESLKAACEAYYALGDDPTIGSNHYFNPDVASPDWHDENKVKARIGRHVFLRL